MCLVRVGRRYNLVACLFEPGDKNAFSAVVIKIEVHALPDTVGA